MNKSRLAIGLMTSLLSAGVLASCSNTVTYSPDGVILTYKSESGEVESYTADDLFSDEFQDSSNYQKVFDAAYKIIIKNYFTEVDPDQSEYGRDQLPDLKVKAQDAVNGDKQTASRKADTNGTSYDTEFSAILSEKGCENEDELFEYYLYKYEEEKFNENFENVDTNMKIMKSGTSSVEDPKGLYTNNKWNGYFADKVPYHVSHILVKIEDSTSTNYSNAKVSEANARKLNNVAQALKDNIYGSFADAAYLSDDSATRGDLGLVDMDKTAQYIDEFKYAVYAYENLYLKEATSKEVQESKISLGEQTVIDQYNEYNHLYEDKVSSKGFAEIPYGAFEILNDNRERETGFLDQKVNDGDQDFYPRNIYFNHFFNRHSLALVSPEKAAKEHEYDDYLNKISTEKYEETLKDGAIGTGFHNFTEADGVGFTGVYLATSIKLGNTVFYRPILVVRGGSSGDSGYQGIHFIVINRSPFEYVDGSESDVSVASLENYYTTYFPKQSKYPTYVDEDEKTVKYQTYVNFSGNEDDYQTRAEEVKSAIKGYDSEGLKHFMFRKYRDSGKLSIKDSKIASGLEKWMTRSSENKEYNSEVEWENKWISYIETLKQAKNIQRKAVSLTCAIGFSENHAYEAGDTAEVKAEKAKWNEIGGECNNGKRYN